MITKNKKQLLMGGFSALLVITAFALYFQQTLSRPLSKNEQWYQELDAIIELPEGQPIVATVTEKEKLANEVFYQKAENGDVVFFFEEARRAILYRPSIRKVVEVSLITSPDIFHRPGAESGE